VTTFTAGTLVKSIAEGLSIMRMAALFQAWVMQPSCGLAGRQEVSFASLSWASPMPNSQVIEKSALNNDLVRLVGQGYKHQPW
jgi:hypothetical protein